MQTVVFCRGFVEFFRVMIVESVGSQRGGLFLVVHGAEKGEEPTRKRRKYTALQRFSVRQLGLAWRVDTDNALIQIAR